MDLGSARVITPDFFASSTIRATSSVITSYSIHYTKLYEEKAAAKIMAQAGLEKLLITCGKAGMVLYETGKPVVTIASKARQVFDVSGAGDTVISLLGLGLASGATFEAAAGLANFAAGIVITSYSIHYTKLYDSGCSCDRPRTVFRSSSSAPSSRARRPRCSRSAGPPTPSDRRSE